MHRMKTPIRITSEHIGSMSFQIHAPRNFYKIKKNWSIFHLLGKVSRPLPSVKRP